MSVLENSHFVIQVLGFDNLYHFADFSSETRSVRAPGIFLEAIKKNPHVSLFCYCVAGAY